MAVDKARVIERFNPKFGTLSMPKLKLDAMSAKFALLIPDDATDEVIDSFLDTMNEAHPFKDIVADEHRKANPPKPTPTPANPAPADPANPTPAPDAPKEDPIMAALNKLTEKIERLEGEKKQTSLKEKRDALLKEKNIPEASYRLIPLPQSEEELEAHVAQIQTNYTELQQTISNNSIGGGRPAYGQAGANKKEASKEEVDAVMSKMNL